ncbi:MAG: ABC-F family ATP-binding cassette domain-containing protein [Deltaproteobacteria bacterium]|nr:ABC-F family ATP-binding cassette domain-containing protein [Deltaproteobacteria bacterium]
MLQFENVHMQLGTKVVLDGVDLRVSDRDRVAIVGRNGAGKSTLMKIAAGLLPPDGGRILLSRGEDVGYLAQEHAVTEGQTLWQEAQAAVQPILDLELKANDLLQGLDSGALSEKEQMALLEEADRLQEAFRVRGGYRLEADVGRVLSGLGFEAEDWERDTATFSGGWQVRIALARLLLMRPRFLLLDEPTNHLDIETRTWLLHELRAYPGGVVIVGHDRDFLDRLVNRTVEVRMGNVESSAGGYTAWARARVERIAQLSELSRQRTEERERIQAFINRFRYKASKAAAVQSRVKMLQKLPPIEVPTDDKRAQLRFPDPPPADSPMLEIRSVKKAYDGTTVFAGADASVLAGDRILLVGPNGAGKSTLLRMLSGDERPDDGVMQPRPSTRVAWFAQDQARALNPDHTVMQAAAEGDPLLLEQRLRTALGAMLFSGDDVHKLIGVLSGGERSRVALAKILLRRANLLLLDEPTNHLDVETKEALVNALGAWPGALILVSHDRVFANAVANQVWEVGDGTIRRHVGDFDDFLWRKAEEMGVVSRRAPGQTAPDAWLLKGLPTASDGDVGLTGSSKPKVQAAEGAREAVDTVEPESKESWEEAKRRKRESAKREKRLEQLLGIIDELETKLGVIDAQLATPEVGGDWERMQEFLNQRDPLERRRDRAMAEWEQLESQ